MSKTNLEWLQELPEPYRSQAIKNCKRLDGDTGFSVVDALAGAFNWDDSPQGHEYWAALHNELEGDSFITVQDLGEAISDIINQDGDTYTDGEVVDQIVDLLKKHNLYTERV